MATGDPQSNMTNTRKAIGSSSSTTNIVDNDEITLDDVAKDDDVFDGDQTALAWGWNSFKPKWLQWLNSPKWFLFFVCCFSALQGMAVNTFINVSLPTLEKRFELTSKHTGFIVAANDIPAVILTVFVGYYGGYGHKTLWLGYGAMLTGFSALVFSFPKLLAGRYQPALLSPGSTTLCKANVTLTDTDCDADASDFNVNFFIFVVAQLLAGAGSTPLFSLGPAYLDENVHPKSMSAYLGVFYLSSFLGPGAGSMIGGQLLSIYVDFNLPDGLKLTPKDYSWVGAWWLGPAVAGFILILDGIILMGFPRKLPGSDAMRKKAIEKGYIKKDKIAARGCKNFLPYMKALLTNWTYMFQNLGFLASTIIGFGIGPFIFKFLTGRYGATPFEAGVSITLLLLPSTALGITIGSIIVKKLGVRDSCRRAAKATFLLQLVGIWGAPFFLISGCDYGQYAGADVGYVNRSLVQLTDYCNQDCLCSTSRFRPLCGPNGNSYFSPCFAGCTQHIPNKGFTNCSCVSLLLNETTMIEDQAVLTEGACHQHCPRTSLYAFICGSFFSITVGFLNVIPSKTVTLRSVSESQRAMALAMQFLFLRLLAGIPSPVMVGAIIDATCTLWKTKCNVNQNCLNYDYNKLGRLIVAMGMPSQFLSLICYGISWRFSKDDSEKTTTDQVGADNEGGDVNDDLELNQLNDNHPRSEPLVTSF